MIVDKALAIVPSNGSATARLHRSGLGILTSNRCANATSREFT